MPCITVLRRPISVSMPTSKRPPRARRYQDCRLRIAAITTGRTVVHAITDWQGRRVHANTLGQRGFTIIELLIVIVVIGILAAITVVAYNGIQNRSKVSRVNSDLALIKRVMLSYKAVNSELPPTGDSWNFDTSPPSCTSINTLETALRTANIVSTIPKQDPWGNCWGYDDNDCNTTSGVGTQTFIRSVGPDATNYTADDIILLVATKDVAC